MEAAAPRGSHVELAKAAGYLALDRENLAVSQLDGHQLGGAGVSLIFIDLEPGGGPRLHRHPYKEIFIVLEGEAIFTVRSEILARSAGKVLVVQPGVPHKFVNSGLARLRQVDVHESPVFVTEWLEESAAAPADPG